MGEILFYYIDCDHARIPETPLIPGVSIEVWRPSGLGLAPPCGLSLLSRTAWPACHWSHLFGNRDHAILWMHRDGACVHRTLLIPPFFRFPFMARDDLQCGDIWTAPAERGRGLAAAGVTAAVRHAWRRGRRIWYLTDAANGASRKLAHRTGFQCFGEGQRTRRLGLRLFGQFVVTTPASDIG